MNEATVTEVLAANEAFYQAFVRRDVQVMGVLWARTVDVSCTHPGWSTLRGRDRVMASWRGIFVGGTPPIECVDAQVAAVGDTAIVTCVEKVPGAQLAATNVFVREGGAWRIVLHHASPIAGSIEDDENEDGADEPPRMPN